MAGALRKTMMYLGLAEDQPEQETDESYEYLDDFEEQEVPVAEERETESRVTPITRAHSVRPRPVTAPATDLRRIRTVHPRTYSDAKTIGSSFREGIPVIMNLSDMSDSDAKRMVDFAAGLIFGLHGAIERVTSKVFLLSPSTVTIASDGDDEADPSSGVYNQN